MSERVSFAQETKNLHTVLSRLRSSVAKRALEARGFQCSAEFPEEITSDLDWAQFSVSNIDLRLIEMTTLRGRNFKWLHKRTGWKRFRLLALRSRE